MTGLATAALYAGVPDVSAAGYTVQTLNAPGPAARMSGNGAVTGSYQTKCTTLSSQPHRTYCYYAPWVFDGQQITKLGKQWPSLSDARAYAVNNSLELVGSDVNGAWLNSAGTVTYTGTLPGGWAGSGNSLSAINNTGMAVGKATNATPQNRAVTFQNGGSLAEVFFNDPYLANPATESNAVDINDSGLIVGWYIASDKTQHGFVVDSSGTVTLIPNLSGAANCAPGRISRQANPTTGQVLVAGNCYGHAFIYEYPSGKLTELATLPGASGPAVAVGAINSSGVAVGTTASPGGVATVVMWPAGSTIPTDLNANQAFAPTNALNLRAIDIDEAGTVLTGYNDMSANYYTFLLHPIP